MPEIVIALGSNVGDSVARIGQAVELLWEHMHVSAVSPLYRTEPMYVLDQPPFINGALLAETTASPRDLLRICKSVEAEIGRLARERYGPREIDVDLIAYGRLKYRFQDEGRVVLELPHPRVIERRFVLAPLADIAPELDLVGLGTVENLLIQTNDQAGSVLRIDHADVSIHRNR